MSIDYEFEIHNIYSTQKIKKNKYIYNNYKIAHFNPPNFLLKKGPYLGHSM